MNKKYVTILSIATICVFIFISIFAVANRSLNYKKTVVVDDRADAQMLNSTNLEEVEDVKLYKLPDAESFFDTHQLQFWYDDKLLLSHINPLFKFDKDMKLVRDMSSPYSAYLNPKTDFSKNALYLMNPADGKMEQLAQTNPYNVVKCCLSPDRAQMLVFEAYNIIGADGAQNAARTKSDSESFAVDGYGNVRNRIRTYDFKTKHFSVIDEWDSKYFMDKNDYGDIGLYNTFGGLSWSLDGKGIVYSEKNAMDRYTFIVFNLETGTKSEYTLQESGGRFERVIVHAASKDLKKIWFSGVSGFMGDGFGFDIAGAKSSIYLLDLNNLNKGAQELVKNMVSGKVLNDENTIIYAAEPNDADSTFKLYQYEMSKKRNKLIDENVLNSKFEISKDEKTIAYLSSADSGFEINMIRINSDPKPEKIMLYKSDPDVYSADGLCWSNDSSEVAVSYYIDNGSLKYSGKVCVLTLKKE